MNLRDYLHVHEISRKQLAERAGIQYQTLYGIMNGRNARFHDICRILVATDHQVSIFEILSEELLEEMQQILRKKSMNIPLINREKKDVENAMLHRARNKSLFR